MSGLLDDQNVAFAIPGRHANDTYRKTGATVDNLNAPIA